MTRTCKRELKIRDGVLLVSLTWTIIPLVASIPLLLHFSGELSFIDAYFEMASALTTTGATIFTGLDTMPPSINLWRHLVNWFGGMGSTGGGIKMIRTLVIWRQAANQIKQLMHPRAILPLRIGGRPMPESLPAAVLGFTFLYFMSVVTLTFALLLSGLDFLTAFSAIIACTNNMGPGLGSVGPSTNYAGFPVIGPA